MNDSAVDYILKVTKHQWLKIKYVLKILSQDNCNERKQK